ncbi:unnamed protein product [Linum tenue]|uniref:CCHC-type domain-containing protein n=1 Tax=Linum tenue TaxID=586396 RepID=A0AAV0H9T0_9ROSI|nr:unnamed protein product [Linum tenue]
MIVWVQLPALKVHFYHKEVLTMLGNLIGRTIRLDYHTLNLERAKFARIAVEVDLSKHLVPRIWLDDALQKVEYENLPTVCFECGKIGHTNMTCPQLRQPTPPTVLAITGGELRNNEVPLEEDPSPGFGPWMLATRKSRRNPRESPVKKGKLENDSGNKIDGNVTKYGNRGTPQKEGEISPQKPPTHTVSMLQRTPNQERKGGADKKGKEENKKGKEKVGSVSNGNDKGVLGSCPEKSANGPKPMADPKRASTSYHPMESPRSDNKTRFPQTTRPSPPTYHTHTGPNGTVMQIVDLQASSIGKQNSAASPLSLPLTTTRMKKNKTSKQGNRRSPAKLNPTKSLQIWTPKKDKKAKSKARIASLTLQEIHGWTNAAKTTPLSLEKKWHIRNGGGTSDNL